MVFGGKEVINPEDLQELDTDMSGILSAKKYTESLSRARDIVKKAACGAAFVIIGVENQKHVHYAMPLRHMLYDGMGYLKEYREITRLYQNSGEKGTKEEFLSKMQKSDRLHPIVTLTIYYGEEAWDGPLSLKDMMAALPKEIIPVFSDYQMNLLEIRKSGKYIFKNHDVQTVFEVSREIFAGNFAKIARKYTSQAIEPELLSVISALTWDKNFLDLLSPQQRKEDGNLCTALEKLEQEKFSQGIKQGVEQGIEQGISRGVELEKSTRILAMLAKGYPISEISSIFDVPQEQVLALKEKHFL